MDSVIPAVLYLHKPEGSTPLACIEAYRKEHPEYAGIKLAYAGRLDPMAEGVLLVLVGNDCKNRGHYEQCTKIYEITVLLGVATDTGDILGLVTDYSKQIITTSNTQLLHAVSSCLGRRQQRFPVYSSKVVSGHPLFWWARHGRLSEIIVPTHEIDVYSIDIIGCSLWNTSDEVKRICQRIAAVSGNFRQPAIAKRWKDTCSTMPNMLTQVELRVSCSSGTYMRELAVEIGEQLGLHACAYTIVRTRIGSYSERKRVY
jgi:tRNA pseudouridine55 synthase